MILKFKDIDNINDIEKYKGKSLYVTREHAVKLKKDEYFIADLIDMQVELEDGTASVSYTHLDVYKRQISHLPDLPHRSFCG